MTTTAQYLDEAERFGANNYHPLPVVLERGEGVYVWDVEGRRYLDMLSAYSALNQGHRHPRIVRALLEQAERLTLTSRAFHNDRLGPFLSRLCQLTGFERALPMNTGAEAVETAIKAARKWGQDVRGVPEGDAEIIVFDGNFHGRTTTIISFSSEPLYRKGFGPFTPGFRLVPYGDLQALRGAMSRRTIAVLVEPIQGEAGVVVPPAGVITQLNQGTIARITGFSCLVLNMLGTSLITFTLRVNGAAIPGGTRLLPAAPLAVAFYPFPLYYITPEHAVVDILATVADAGAYTLQAWYDGWTYPFATQLRYYESLQQVMG